MPVGAPSLRAGRHIALKNDEASQASREAGGAMEEHQRQRKQTIVDLTYCEQRVQEASERLSVLHSSEKNKADFFLINAWDSY